MMKRSTLLVFLFVLSVLLVPRNVWAEVYITGYGGYAFFPHGNGGDTTGTLGDFDLSLKSSVTAGAKVGWWFLDWLGVEGDFVYAKPDLDPQSVRLVVPGVGAGSVSIGEADQELLGGGVSLIGRLPSNTLKGFEPHIGAGVTVLNLEVDGFSGVLAGLPVVFPSENATAVGPQAQAGIKYFLTPQLALGAEYQFRYAKFDFDNIGLEESLMMHSIVGTLSFHFR